MALLNLNGKDHEVSFGKMFLIRISKELGVSFDKLQEYVQSDPIQSSIELMRISLDEGKRKAKSTQPSYSVEQLADIWDNDDELLERFMALFNDSFEKKQNAAT